MQMIFEHINYWAVFVAAIVYWVLGMLWFSVMVGKSWAAEMQKHGVKISKPSSGKMAEKMIWTFILNLIVAFGVAVVVKAMGIHTFELAVGFGLILGICFAVAVMVTSHLWENKSTKLSFYDVFYPFIGILISTIIITLWQ